jgi:phage FluMu protein Com
MTQTHKVCTACGYVGKAVFQFTKLSHIKCPKCETLNMVPLRSREGQAVLTQSSGQPRVWDDSATMFSSK